MPFVLILGGAALELWLLFAVGRTIGALATVAVCLGMAALGASLVKRQGRAVLRRMNEAIAGTVPRAELADGLLLFVGGALLIIPGYVTDAIGLLLLVPPVRALLRPVVLRWVERRSGGPPRSWPRRDDSGPDQEILPPGRGPSPPHPRPPKVIDQ